MGGEGSLPGAAAAGKYYTAVLLKEPFSVMVTHCIVIATFFFFFLFFFLSKGIILELDSKMSLGGNTSVLLSPNQCLI